MRDETEDMVDIIDKESSRELVPVTIEPEETSSKPDETGLYSAEEDETLRKNERIRGLMIDSLTAKGTMAPSDKKDFRVLKEILESSDGAINKRAENRAKHKAAESGVEEMKELTTALLIATSKTMAEENIRRTSDDVTIDEDVGPALELVPGEDSVKLEDIDLDEIVSKKG